MTYVKVDDDIFLNPKMIAVSSGAKLLYIASICYSGSSLTDGFIPKNAPPIFGAQAGITSTAKAVKELVEVGLWDVAERGYQVRNYLEYNESSEKVEAKRKAARERMNHKRNENDVERSREVPANIPRTSTEVQEPTTTIDTTTLSSDNVVPPKPPKGGDAPDDESDDLNGTGPEYSDDFMTFLTAYPKRVGKGAAWRAWKRLKPSKALQDRMIAAVQEQRQWPQWQRENGKFIPNPATWINEARWDDEAPHAASNVRRFVV